MVNPDVQAECEGQALARAHRMSRPRTGSSHAHVIHRKQKALSPDELFQKHDPGLNANLSPAMLVYMNETNAKTVELREAVRRQNR